MLGHWYLHNTIISVLGCHSRKSHDGVRVSNLHICACYMLLYVYYPSSHWGTHTPNQLITTTKALPLFTWTHNFGLGSSSISQRTQCVIVRDDTTWLPSSGCWVCQSKKMEICFFPSTACLPFKCHCEHLNVFKIIYMRSTQSTCTSWCSTHLRWDIRRGTGGARSPVTACFRLSYSIVAAVSHLSESAAERLPTSSAQAEIKY